MAVERHAMLRNGLIAILSSHEDIHLVSTPYTAGEALGDYLTFFPDVTIVDLHLPGGLELIRQIREINVRAKIIPLVGYNWNDHSEDVLAANGMVVLSVDEIGARLLDLIRMNGDEL